MQNKDRGEADGYYGEEEIDETEVDLSFLNDDDDVPRLPSGQSDFSKVEDKPLARSIVSLRQNYHDLTSTTLTVLADMVAEYIRRPEPKYFVFLTSKLDNEVQDWLWGERKTAGVMTLPGYRLAEEGNNKFVEVDSNTDARGVVYRLNRRQLHRTDEFNDPLLHRTKAVVEMGTDPASRTEVQIYVKQSKTEVPNTNA